MLSNVFTSQGGLVSPHQKPVSKGVSINGQFALGEGLLLKSITGYRKDDSANSIDFDALSAADVDVPGFYRNKQFSQEFQLQLNRGPPQGLVGACYLDATAFTAFDVRLLTTVNGFNPFTQGNVGTKTYAVFGDFSYNFSP